MNPAQVRDELIRRALQADHLRLWLASAAHVAICWRRREDGEVYASGPTLAEIAALERQASGLDARDVDSALTLLRSITTEAR